MESENDDVEIPFRVKLWLKILDSAGDEFKLPLDIDVCAPPLDVPKFDSEEEDVISPLEADVPSLEAVRGIELPVEYEDDDVKPPLLIKLRLKILAGTVDELETPLDAVVCVPPLNVLRLDKDVTSPLEAV